MNNKLEKKLYEKYPNFFSERHLPPQQTCMCWGICCGDGWFWLLDETIGAVLKADPKARAEQVKEKYGSLRLYIFGNDKAQAIAAAAEDKSLAICEECGKPGTPNEEGWIRTNCEECRYGPKE